MNKKQTNALFLSVSSYFFRFASKNDVFEKNAPNWCFRQILVVRHPAVSFSIDKNRYLSSEA